jgi:nitrogen regulatory protein P-II 1
MKRLDIIVPHEHVREINDILRKRNVGGITFYDIKGRGRSKNEPIYVGTGVMKYIPEFGLATKVEVLVPDPESKQIIDDIVKITSTYSTSGKIFVYDVAEAYDIGTKTTGDTAL